MNHYIYNGITIKTTLPQHVLDSISYIHRHYHNDLSVDTLAKQQHLNKCYLCQIFKQHTTLTITEFINKVRLEKSKHYLEHSTESILAISLKSGFNNVTYYNKLFKRAYGLTPFQYRKNPQLIQWG